MRIAIYAALLLLILILPTACDHDRVQTNQPNIILIYADDLGIGLLSHEGQQIIKTPNIDKLAEEGIRFQNAYSCMLCAPARASLIAGRHDCHSKKFGITNAGVYKKISTGEYTPGEIEDIINSRLSPVPDEAVFLGEVAKKAGYKTAQFGKLEWGFASTHEQMNRHGWDYYFGYFDHIRAHGFYPPFLFHRDGIIEIDGNTLSNCGKSVEPETQESYDERWDMTGKQVYSQNVFMDSVLNFITNHQDQAFFLYFPTQLPHGPVSIPSVHTDFAKDSRLTQIEKEYASMVKMLDDNVGQIMQKLKNLNIDDNTIVIFTSDNGHEIYYELEGRIHKPYTNMNTGALFDNLENKYYSDPGGDVFDGNGGRAGLKRSNLQGGIEVPLIIRWPEKIEAKRISKLLVANYDLLATIAEITGYSNALNSDGISFYHELTRADPGTEHDFVVFSSFLGPTLITKDGWKIRSYLDKEAFELYYLPDDFREENDLAEKFPDKLKDLKNKLLKACDGDFNNGLYSSQKNQIKIE